MFSPKYTISNQTVNQLSEIAEIKSLVARSVLLPNREVFLRRAAVIKMAHSSTSIEGNQLQEYQVAQVAEGKEIHAEERQIREVKNYLLALREIDKLSESKNEAPRANARGIFSLASAERNLAEAENSHSSTVWQPWSSAKADKFTSQDVLKVHKAVINGLIDQEKAGVWRPGPVYVVNILPNKQEEVTYTPPPAKEVPILIQDLLDWLGKNNDIHPIIGAGLFHYQFETIHPFTDGNGRTGRLMTLLHLYQSGWDFKKILVLEDYYNHNRKAYYEALQTGSTYNKRQEVDLSSWLEYYVTGFLDEAKKVKDQVLSLSVVGDVQAGRNILDKDELQIVDFAITMGKITSSDVADILEVPKRTAQAKLKRLEDIKILEKVGAGPSTYYTIPKIS